MAKLTTKKRNSLKSSTFVFPGTRKFPIPDASHARNALSRAGAQGGSVESKVRAAVHRKFPSIGKMHEGGIVPMTGDYTLQKGEKVIPADACAAHHDNMATQTRGDCAAPASIHTPNGDGVGDEKDMCDPIGDNNYFSGLPGTHGDRAHRANDQWKENQTHPMVKQQAGRTETSNVDVLKSEA